MFLYNFSCSTLETNTKFSYFSARRNKRFELISNLIQSVWEFCEESASHMYPQGGCRFIVTRIGRIGAGETKEWAKLIQEKLKKGKRSDSQQTLFISGKSISFRNV